MILQGEQVRELTLLKKNVSHGDHNEPIETWIPFLGFYAEWWDQGGRESLQNGQIVARKDIRARCRYISDLNESDYRVRKDDQDYDIESIKEIGRRRGQLLMLKVLDNA